jgi:hypothetical protein
MKESDFEVFEPIFKVSENWGDIEKVQWYHVHQLYQIRKAMGVPMVIHCCFAKDGHSTNSYHYQGLATDFHFLTNMSFKDQTAIMLQTLEKLKLIDFCGFGAYLEWVNKGFHYDTRGVSAMWVQKDKKYQYGFYNVKQIVGF